MSNLTLDVIGLCGFGVDFDAIADEEGFMAGLYKGLMKEMTVRILQNGFNGFSAFVQIVDSFLVSYSFAREQKIRCHCKQTGTSHF